MQQKAGEDVVTGAPVVPTGIATATAMAVAAMVCVQVGSALARPVIDDYGPFATNWGRLTWAAIILALLIRPKLRSYGRNEILTALALGTVIALMMLAFLSAIARVPLGLVVAIEFLGPLGVAALGFARSWRVVWLLLALAGVFALVLDRQGWSVDPVGVALALLAGVGWGSYILLSKRVGAIFRGLDGLAISFVFAALIATPFGLAETRMQLPPDLAMYTIGLALLTPLLPFALEMLALKRLPSATFGILMSAEPGIGALAGYVILHEALSPQQVAGIAAVICASVGAVLSTRA